MARLAWCLSVAAFAVAVLVASVGGQAAPYDQTVLADSPYGYWRFGEASGTTAVNLGSGGAALRVVVM